MIAGGRGKKKCFLLVHIYVLSLPTALGAHAALGPGGRGRRTDIVPVGRDMLVWAGVRRGLLDALSDLLLTFYEFLSPQFVQLEVE